MSLPKSPLTTSTLVRAAVTVCDTHRALLLLLRLCLPYLRGGGDEGVEEGGDEFDLVGAQPQPRAPRAPSARPRPRSACAVDLAGAARPTRADGPAKAACPARAVDLTVAARPARARYRLGRGRLCVFVFVFAM